MMVADGFRAWLVGGDGAAVLLVIRGTATTAGGTARSGLGGTFVDRASPRGGRISTELGLCGNKFLLEEFRPIHEVQPETRLSRVSSSGVRGRLWVDCSDEQAELVVVECPRRGSWTWRREDEGASGERVGSLASGRFLESLSRFPVSAEMKRRILVGR